MVASIPCNEELDMTTATLAPDLARMLAETDPALVDVLADDVVLRASGEAEWAGTHIGKEAVVGYLLELGETFPDQQVEVIDTLVSDRRVAVIVRITLRREGAAVTDESTWTFTFGADGLIIDWELNDFDQTAMDAFWSRFPRHGA